MTPRASAEDRTPSRDCLEKNQDFGIPKKEVEVGDVLAGLLRITVMVVSYDIILAKTPTGAAPTEKDRLRMAQELLEMQEAARVVCETAKAREAYRQQLCNAWCRIRAQKEMDREAITSMTHWLRTNPIAEVLEWVRMADERHPGYSDNYLCRYIGGIHRKVNSAVTPM